MALDTWIAFTVLWITFALIPGPSALFCVSMAVGVGMPRAMGAPIGIAVGSVVHATIAALGVGTVLLASAELFALFKWIGVAYLVYLGVRQWRMPGVFTGSVSTRSMSSLQVASEALLVMLTNPKSIFAYAAVLPLFIDPTAPFVAQVLILTATTASIAFIVNAGYAALAVPIRRWLSSHRREVFAKRALASLFVLCALGLGVADRR